MAHLTTCPDCGSKAFIVAATCLHDATVDGRGVLTFTGGLMDGDIDAISCAKCGRAFEAEAFTLEDGADLEDSAPAWQSMSP